MNIAVGITGSKHLAETDSTDISVGRVGPDPAAQAEAPVEHISADAHDTVSTVSRVSDNGRGAPLKDPSSGLEQAL